MWEINFNTLLCTQPLAESLQSSSSSAPDFRLFDIGHDGRVRSNCHQEESA